MMEIKIMSIGQIKEKYNALMIEDYVKRIKAYAKISEVVINNWLSDDGAVCCEKEGLRLLDAMDENYYNILLDIEGFSLNSVEFAKKISDIITYKNSKICFIIGGSHGVSKAVKDKCQYAISFSKMTFPHQLMKGILLEQIYRACKINNNERYHK